MNHEPDMLTTDHQADVESSDAVIEPQPETVIQPKQPFWSRWFGNRQVSAQEALFELSEAIERHPQAPTNYLLRGEYYLQIGYNQLAEEDFQQAVQLADVELSKRDWGLVAQVVRDRANRGLTIAHDRLQHSRA